MARYDPPGIALGALVGRPPGEGPEQWDGQQPLIFPFVELPDHQPIMDSFVFASPKGWLGRGLTEELEPFLRKSGATDADIRHGQSMRADVAELVAQALFFVNSFNVELVQGEASRQERRAAERKDGQIALTVQVRQTKRYTSTSQTNGAANYSHRFETRGHYKHYFEAKPDGTPSKVFERCHTKDPSRVVTVNGKPCFRFWVPPFVKGPADKPFVPKVRTVAKP